MAASWFVARDRLLPRRRVRPEEELAGHVAALLALGVVGLLVVATNPFALVFLLHFFAGYHIFPIYISSW